MATTELYTLELREFYAIYEGWMKRQEQLSRERWEIARWQSGVSIMPHITTQKPLFELLPLPWDKAEVEDSSAIGVEERRAQALEMLKYLEKNE